MSETPSPTSEDLRPRLPRGIAACLFDLDGVLTRTAEIHAAAWKRMFDSFLREWVGGTGSAHELFDPVGDYAAHVDGRPRADGVRAFLASRGIRLPEGAPEDPPSAETVHGLANRKNELVGGLIERQGVRAYEGSVRFLGAVRAAGLACAVVTSSENAEAVLRAAGLATLEVSGDEVEAGERLEAATLSDDPADVDIELVDEAMEALEVGDHEQAVSLLDAALSRPLGADAGKSLHEAGREFRPATGTQEVVGIIAGAALILLGAWALRPRRLRGAAP